MGPLPLQRVPCTLSMAPQTDCYQIVATSTPADHEMDLVPDNISVMHPAGGNLLENGEV